MPAPNPGGRTVKPTHPRCHYLLIILAMIVGATTARAEASEGRRSRHERTKIEVPAPQVSVRLSVPQRFALLAAFKTAYRRAQESESCAALFEDLELDAAKALTASRYDLPSSSAVQARCRAGVAAVTGVRSPHIRLCRRFGTMSRGDQAVVLLHEALHVAGLDEWPQDPKAQTAREITKRVKEACSL